MPVAVYGESRLAKKVQMKVQRRTRAVHLVTEQKVQLIVWIGAQSGRGKLWCPQTPLPFPRTSTSLSLNLGTVTVMTISPWQKVILKWEKVALEPLRAGTQQTLLFYAQTTGMDQATNNKISI